MSAMSGARLARELARIRDLRHEISSVRLAAATSQMQRAAQWRAHVDEAVAQEKVARWERAGAALHAWTNGDISAAEVAMNGLEAARRETALSRHNERAREQEQASDRLLRVARKETAQAARGCERVSALLEQERRLQVQREASFEALIDEEAALSRSFRSRLGRER